MFFKTIANNKGNIPLLVAFLIAAIMITVSAAFITDAQQAIRSAERSLRVQQAFSAAQLGLHIAIRNGKEGVSSQTPTDPVKVADNIYYQVLENEVSESTMKFCVKGTAYGIERIVEQEFSKWNFSANALAGSKQFRLKRQLDLQLPGRGITADTKVTLHNTFNGSYNPDEITCNVPSDWFNTGVPPTEEGRRSFYSQVADNIEAYHDPKVVVKRIVVDECPPYDRTTLYLDDYDVGNKRVLFLITPTYGDEATREDHKVSIEIHNPVDIGKQVAVVATNGTVKISGNEIYKASHDENGTEQLICIAPTFRLWEYNQGNDFRKKVNVYARSFDAEIYKADKICINAVADKVSVSGDNDNLFTSEIYSVVEDSHASGGSGGGGGGSGMMSGMLSPQRLPSGQPACPDFKELLHVVPVGPEEGSGSDSWKSKFWAEDVDTP